VTNVSPSVHPSRQGDDVEAWTARLAVAAGLLLVLSVAAALTVHAHPGRILGLGHSGQVGQAAPQPPVSTTAAPAPGRAPGPGQQLVSGTVTSLTASNANSLPLKPPFTITVAARGQGGASITEVQVGGRTVAISWLPGQPLPVSGTGTLDLQGAPVVVDASGITWTLDGAAHPFTAGHFTLGAPVAVGPAGVAQPVGSVSFTAGPQSTILTTGGAVAHLPPASIHLEGPGRVTLRGQFTLRSTSGTKTVTSITLGVAPKSYSYSIDLVRVAGGYTITDAILQGPVKAT
jgi:hypothetical protein